MDRRVLFATLILLAGGATGVGVALFAFVGIDDGAADSEIVWETDPVDGDDGSGAVVATADGDPLVVQSTVEDGERVIRATAVGDDVEWRAPLSSVATGDASGGDDGSDDGSGNASDDEATDVSGLVSGTLDGDEVVAFTTESGTLVVLDAADGSTRFTADLDGPGGIRPAIGDLTDDGRAEVAAVTTDGNVRAVDADGDAAFETALGEPVDRRPLIADFEDDSDDGGTDDAEEANGTPRGLAVVTAGEEGTVRLIDGEGETRWTTTPSVTPLSWNAVDTRDGPILALGGSSGTLETIELADGSGRYDVGLQDRPVDVGDADAGRVYVGGVGSVWAVDLLDGEVVWKQQYGGETRVNAPGIGNVSGDAGPGPVAVNREGGVLALNANGEAIARGDAGEAVVYAGPLFADATGDETDEVLVVTDDGRVVALDG
ncbi:PQQ-binding-like beta-propeller repeat protein [Halorubrum sp. AD140]|uniref:outer membrane protein assembly factor BamB family protein n=1 Tax=Halorubrum sp. AD140 TaxID=3050073 RepID=UPI002ACD04FE|nr:PQQ-binding-like beta-propeller repeat protein [Halorubrum sp. AD140]MDZ5811286.1 PQQ-binding-like beta-propeller repeat protein [Halorubrum sp. AD140]